MSATLAADGWADYFSSVVRDGESYMATVEVQGNGDGRHAGLLRPLMAISYDSDSEMLVVVVGGGGRRDSEVRYFVSSPRAIEVQGSRDAKAIVVEDSSGVRTLVQLFRCAPRGAPRAGRPSAVGGRSGGGDPSGPLGRSAI